jgi:predicted amidohydrolase
LVEQAVAAQAVLLCLPECFAFMGIDAKQVYEQSEPLDGKLMQRYRSLAQRHRIWLSLGGFHERSGRQRAERKIHNTHLLINDQGELVTQYQKVHLFSCNIDANNCVDEGAHPVAGTPFVNHATPFGNVGLSTCYDLRFPYLYNSLRNTGAQILLVPSAFTVPSGRAHWEVLLRARAIENQCYVLAAAQAGVHNEAESKARGKTPRRSYGHACIIDPWGEVKASLGGRDSGIVVAEIDLGFLRQIRNKMPVESHQRHDV